MNIAITACDPADNLFVAFRCMAAHQKYSSDAKLISENQFTIPSERTREPQRKYYSLEFFAKYQAAHSCRRFITHSISVGRRGTGYLLLNAHSIVIFAPSGKVTRQFHFRSPKDRGNVFIRVSASLKSNGAAYLLDTRSGEIYETSKL